MWRRSPSGAPGTPRGRPRRYPRDPAGRRGRGGVLYLLNARRDTLILREQMTAQQDRLRALAGGILQPREEEARRTTHELHDEAGQLLASVHIALDHLAQQIPERTGVRGYVLKKQAAADLVCAIRSPSPLPEESLTAREREVLQLIAEGKTTKEISAILGASVKTADAHRTRLMQKLDIHDIAGLTRYAIRLGLIEP